MRREFTKRHPAAPSPIQDFRDYSPEDRSSLMRAVGAAVRSSQPEFDAGFSSWCERRSVNVD
jgi:hypothetical protein